MTLIEPDVALTDFGLAVECALFAGWLYWRGAAGSPLGRWFVVLFVALGIGALLGGVTHGFLPETGSDAARIYWNAVWLRDAFFPSRAPLAQGIACRFFPWYLASRDRQVEGSNYQSGGANLHRLHPRCREAAEGRPIVSIAASGGTARPSAFAVFRLITKTNLVGLRTDKSVGFSP